MHTYYQLCGNLAVVGNMNVTKYSSREFDSWKDQRVKMVSWNFKCDQT